MLNSSFQGLFGVSVFVGIYKISKAEKECSQDRQIKGDQTERKTKVIEKIVFVILNI